MRHLDEDSLIIAAGPLCGGAYLLAERFHVSG